MPEPDARANAVPPPAAWAALTDVDARVTQPLLDSLEDAGVAAYASAGPGDTDRLHVDATRRDLAEAVVAAELPGLLAELGPVVASEAEIDPFDAIVAGWDSVPETPSWPALEDVAARPTPAVAEPVEAPRPAPRPRADEDHFVPPPLPPTPPAAPVTRYAVAAVVLGLVVLVVLPLIGQRPSQEVFILGAISLLAGLGTLVWRMRDGPSVDDGPEDGAVV
jgi:hypothetical protein